MKQTAAEEATGNDMNDVRWYKQQCSSKENTNKIFIRSYFNWSRNRLSINSKIHFCKVCKHSKRMLKYFWMKELIFPFMSLFLANVSFAKVIRNNIMICSYGQRSRPLNVTFMQWKIPILAYIWVTIFSVSLSRNFSTGQRLDKR